MKRISRLEALKLFEQDITVYILPVEQEFDKVKLNRAVCKESIKKLGNLMLL